MQQEMMKVIPEQMLSPEDLDHALHECMVTIWKAYRTSTKDFNGCFDALYKKYTDPAVVRFVECMGLGLCGACNRKVRDNDSRGY